MKSSSAADSSAGTGARQVKITYLPADMSQTKTETIPLNGTTAVATVATDIAFIEKMEVVSVGSGGVAAGTITLHSNTAGSGTTIGSIATGATRTFWSHHYVATGKTCTITGQFVSAGKNTQNSTFFLKYQNPLVANSVDDWISENLRSSGNGTPTLRNYQTPLQVSGPARIVQWVTPDGTQNMTQYGSFDFYEE